MNYVTLIGIIAATLTTGASLPQLIKSFKTRQTEDISYYMYLFLTIGIFLWLVYGILDRDIPLIYANFFAMLIVYPIFFLKIKNDVWKR
jgi:MtN3 and saliva related transmembrane protein|tara:strand:- start:892 stop:1158 length:267 start_codon:yes stop_codon:yes gene_type:complete